MNALDVSRWEAQTTVARFQAHDDKTLLRQHAVYHDETQLIQTSKEAANELQGLLESDTQEASTELLGDRPVFSPSDVR